MKALLLLLLCSFQLLLFSQDAATEAYLQKGKEYYTAAEFNKAEASFQQAVNSDADNYEARKYLADSKHKQEKYYAAIDDYDQAEKLNQEDAELYFNRGVAKIFVGDFKGAIKDFDESEDMDTSRAELYYYRGYCYSEFNRYESAIEDYNRCIMLDPDNAAAYYNRGAAIAELGNYEEGMKDFEKALEKDPDIQGGKINIALTKLGQKQYEAAIEDFTSIIDERDENLARAYFYRGEAYYELDKKDDACSDWRKSANLKFDKAAEFVDDFCDGKRKAKRREIDIVF